MKPGPAGDPALEEEADGNRVGTDLWVCPVGRGTWALPQVRPYEDVASPIQSAP